MRRLALLAGIAPAAALAAAFYELPPERPVVLPDAPATALVAAHCSACHSLDYLTTQPPGLGADHWRHTVEKMISLHGADIAADDRAAIEAWLAEQLG